MEQIKKLTSRLKRQPVIPATIAFNLVLMLSFILIMALTVQHFQ